MRVAAQLTRLWGCRSEALYALLFAVVIGSIWAAAAEVSARSHQGDFGRPTAVWLTRPAAGTAFSPFTADRPPD